MVPQKINSTIGKKLSSMKAKYDMKNTSLKAPDEEKKSANKLIDNIKPYRSMDEETKERLGKVGLEAYDKNIDVKQFIDKHIKETLKPEHLSDIKTYIEKIAENKKLAEERPVKKPINKM
jgi:hypothetical protein